MRVVSGIVLPLVALAMLASGCERRGAEQPEGLKSPQAGVLRRGNGGDPGSLDPALAEDIHAFNVLADLYEGLVTTDAAGKLVPGAAKSWRISDDGRTYTFELREDGRWSNGEPVVAQDFVRALRRAASPDVLSSYAFLLEPIEHFTEIKSGERPVAELGVEATGDRQLTIRLGAAASHFLSMLSMAIAYPAHASVAASGDFADVAKMIVNGPYTVRSRQPMGPIRLQRNPQFRDAASVSFDEVVFYPIVDEVAELNMYRSGELDITHTVPSTHLANLRTGMPGQLRIAPMLAFYYAAFDMTEPPFDDRALRHALAVAVDREELARIIGRGEVPAYGIVPPGTAGYAAPPCGLCGLDRNERERLARDWLSRSRHADKLPRLTYLYDSGDIHEKIAIAVTAMWRDVLGIDVQLEKREWQYFLDTRDKRDEWQIMRFSWFGDYNDAMTFLDVFRSDSPQNLPAYVNDDYDRYVNAASVETDPGKRAENIAAAELALLNDYPVVPLYFYVSKHMVRRELTGFGDNALDRHPSRYIGFKSITGDDNTGR